MDDAERAVSPASPASPASPGHGTVLLSRVRGGGRDALRGYAVLIDGAQAGSIRRGQTLRFDVPAGTHQLQLKIDWCTSRALSTLVEEGGTVRFICAPGGDASEGLAAVGDGGGSYITLRQARTSESTVMARTPMGRRARLLVGAAIGFLAGGVTLFGALIWHWTGLAPKADTAVAGVGLALTLVSMIVFRLGRRTLK